MDIYTQPTDPGVERVRQFHEAFGIEVPAAPVMPPLLPVERAIMRDWAETFRKLAEQLKSDAAYAHASRLAVLGVLLVRLQLHCEEACAEFAEALAEQDLVKALDALADSDYVVNGSFLTLGLGALKSAARERVHASNMSKLGDDGRPIIAPSGRVVKGPRYAPPELGSLLEVAS